MSQSTFSIANEAGASFRSDNNAALQALASQSSGAAAPATTYAYQRWADTTNGVIKRRNAANSGWVVDGTLAETYAVARSSNTILAMADHGKIFRGTGSFTQTFTAAATLGDGWFCSYRVESGNTVTFDPNSTEQIDGATTKAVTGPASGIIWCDGAGFYTIGYPASSTIATLPMGRLTLTTALPVTTADVTAATTLYYTPAVGNTVPIWNGSAFANTSFTELSQLTTDATKSPAAVAANKAYDIFVWSDSGTLRATRGPAWSSDTSRGTGAGTSELQQTNGVWNNKNAITNGPAAGYGTYVGTVYSDGSSQLNDSLLKRHVWNMYNRVNRAMKRVESTASWTYATATWRQANAAAANQLDFIQGFAEEPVYARVEVRGTNGGGNNAMPVGIALDATNTTNADTWGGDCVTAGNTAFAFAATYNQVPALGRHYLAWTEYVSSGTATYYGASANVTQGGMTGMVRG